MTTGQRHTAPAGTQQRRVPLLRHHDRRLSCAHGREPRGRGRHHRRLMTGSVARRGTKRYYAEHLYTLMLVQFAAVSEHDQETTSGKIRKNLDTKRITSRSRTSPIFWTPQSRGHTNYPEAIQREQQSCGVAKRSSPAHARGHQLHARSRLYAGRRREAGTERL